MEELFGQYSVQILTLDMESPILMYMKLFYLKIPHK